MSGLADRRGIAADVGCGLAVAACCLIALARLPEWWFVLVLCWYLWFLGTLEG